MDILLLRGFNNYFNRIVKKYSTIADYKTHSASFLEFTGINFNPNDGVATELILGSPSQQESSAPLAWDQLGTPDYLLCTETSNGTTTIKFRWFVLESERTRDGQYRLALKRDVIADHLNEVMNAPCYIEKGIIRDPNNPLIVNPEGATVNQIKQSETPLVDETNSTWLVGYINKKFTGKTHTDTMTGDLENVYDYDSLFFKDCISFSDGSTTPSKQLINDLGSNCLNMFFTIRGNSSFGVSHYYCYRGSLVWGTWIQMDYMGSQGNANYAGTNDRLIESSNNNNNSNWATWMMNATGTSDIPVTTRDNFFNFLKSSLKSTGNLYEMGDIQSGTTISDLRTQWSGAIIRKGGKFYKLSFSSGGGTWIASTFNGGSSAHIGSYFSYVINALNAGSGGNPSFSFNGSTSTNTLDGRLNYSPVTIMATEVSDIANSITINIPSANDRINCDDALYDIFAVPYIPRQYREDYTSEFNYNSNNYIVDSDACLFIVQKLLTELGFGGGASKAYDIQLLPYCPINLPINNAGKVALGQLDSKSYTIITKHVVTTVTPEEGDPYEEEADVPIGYVLFPNSANFTKNVTFEKNIALGTNSPALAAKLSNECDFLRITAPNFNSSFEFKLSKMLDNEVHYINVDCTYRPINPYIKMNPDFTWLYGTDWNDSTGLLFNGDFSLATLTDPWINYELSNKNYQAMFNRQIQSMDVNQQLARDQMNFSNLTGAITGSFTGAAGGALTGAKLAGPYGAIAGGVAGFAGGTVLGIAGGLKNNEWLARQQGEAKSYAIDMYNYQLGNIKALPQSLTKSDPITYNNKVWPVIEEFSCTDEEKEIIKNKIKYNSMTVMAIGTLNDYSVSSDFDTVYVKGQLIRLTDVADDFHVVDAIYQEVDKGFYIPQ